MEQSANASESGQAKERHKTREGPVKMFVTSKSLQNSLKSSKIKTTAYRTLIFPSINTIISWMLMRMWLQVRDRLSSFNVMVRKSENERERERETCVRLSRERAIDGGRVSLSESSESIIRRHTRREREKDSGGYAGTRRKRDQMLTSRLRWPLTFPLD